MLKVFKYNKAFSFDMEGNCEFNGNSFLPDTEGKFLVEINNKRYRLHKSWLGLVTHYEFHYDFLQIVNNVTFVPFFSKVIRLRCKKLPVFKKPIKVKNGFFLIPGFPDLIINKNGVVKKLKDGYEIPIHCSPYPCVSVYDPDKSRYRDVAIHVLLSRVFIPNPDPSIFCYVNHKNGNKLDFSLSNLEWVTSRENNIHAVKSGLRKDNHQCEIRDVSTNEVTRYFSVSSALAFLGRVSTSVNRNRCRKDVKTFLYDGKYELRLNLEDPWYYTTKERINEKFTMKGPYEGYNRDTGKFFEAETIPKLAKICGLHSSTVHNLLRLGENVSNNGFSFRVKSNGDWKPVTKKIKFTPSKTVKITNTVTGEILIFNSKRKVLDFLGIDKRTLKKRVNEKKPYNCWNIEVINCPSD